MPLDAANSLSLDAHECPPEGGGHACVIHLDQSTDDTEAFPVLVKAYEGDFTGDGFTDVAFTVTTFPQAADLQGLFLQLPEGFTFSYSFEVSYISTTTGGGPPVVTTIICEPHVVGDGLVESPPDPNVNMQGSQVDFDVGFGFGDPGLGQDVYAIQIVISSDTDLTLADFEGLILGVRAQSVGDDREGSAKIWGEIRCEVEEECLEGLTPGFWRQVHNLAKVTLSEECQDYFGVSSWGELLNLNFKTVFGVSGTYTVGRTTVSPDLKLSQAIAYEGGGDAGALLRHATAALLNDCAEEVNYAIPHDELITLVQTAWNSGQISQVAALKNTLEFLNELGLEEDEGFVCYHRSDLGPDYTLIG
ncbi:hypothetical protein [Crenalkalicoccus roseus]|uniref:hypothetical protein n=1 Tax=Crenalkalicoccus roseus TaxID=1485588 RepID=UPI0010811FF4|nr:hypothetical protein [Crenalkalicoccus roseus]